MGFVYRLEFPNGKSYIGITTASVRSRFVTHAKRARLGSAFPVHVAWRKYGAPVLSVMADIEDKEALGSAEVRAIAELKTFVPNGYNATRGGYTAPSKSPYVAAKLSAASKGFTSEAVAKGRALLKGRPLTEEHKRKLSEALRGRCPSGRETRLGWTHTEFSKKKMRDAKLGKSHSIETREKLRSFRLGKKLSPETCRRISAARRSASQVFRGVAE